MRLKVFTAPSMNEAMQQVRQQIGEDAIIVSTGKNPEGSGVTITAALDKAEPDLFTPKPANQSHALTTVQVEAEEKETPKTIMKVLTDALDDHGVPDRLASDMLRAAAFAQTEDPILALGAAIDDMFSFSPLSTQPTKNPIMLVGPPGSGKTVTLAKMTARIMLAGHSVQAISTDTVRAGGIDQLSTYMRHMKLDLDQADSPLSLEALLKKQTSPAQILIDSLAVNPYREKEMNNLAKLIEKSGAEPILVIDGGKDAVDFESTCNLFQDIGVERFILTKIDLTRRLGGTLAGAQKLGLSFCEIGTKPEIIEGLTSLNPVSLARLLLPRDLSAADGLLRDLRT